MSLTFTRWPAILAAVLSCVVAASYLWQANALIYARLLRHMAGVVSTFVPSDFFVPWYGARALVRRENAYGERFAEQLHGIFYGAAIQPTAEMQNVAAFSYPPYVAVLLAPTLWLSFEVVRWLAVITLGAAIAGAGALWVRLPASAADPRHMAKPGNSHRRRHCRVARCAASRSSCRS